MTPDYKVESLQPKSLVWGRVENSFYALTLQASCVFHSVLQRSLQPPWLPLAQGCPGTAFAQPTKPPARCLPPLPHCVSPGKDKVCRIVPVSFQNRSTKLFPASPAQSPPLGRARGRSRRGCCPGRKGRKHDGKVHGQGNPSLTAHCINRGVYPFMLISSG